MRVEARGRELHGPVLELLLKYPDGLDSTQTENLTLTHIKLML